MKHPRLRLFVFTLITAALLPALPTHAQSASAPPAAATVDPKAADAVLDRYLEAIGGAESLSQLETRVTKMKMSVAALGVEIAMVKYQKSPDRVLNEQTVPGLGMISMGYDGTTAWSFNPMQGYRELEGAERAALLADSDVRSELNLKNKFPVRERLPDATAAGGTQEVLRLSGGELPAMTCYFDAGSHLLVRMEVEVDAGPTGKLQTETTLEDYRAVNGVKVPHRMLVKGGPMEMQVVIESIEQNVPIEDAKFAPRKS